ncbi:hypothetical protein [Bartonella vinsonii]|uniref:hypothetical protein n=1 Tax=Bartonella vinsonii TaxID=33047 RepID=UPI0003460030|nr:hypothetical protein [Bartonella vinsonii]
MLLGVLGACGGFRCLGLVVFETLLWCVKGWAGGAVSCVEIVLVVLKDVVHEGDS